MAECEEGGSTGNQDQRPGRREVRLSYTHQLESKRSFEFHAMAPLTIRFCGGSELTLCNLLHLRAHDLKIPRTVVPHSLVQNRWRLSLRLALRTCMITYTELEQVSQLTALAMRRPLGQKRVETKHLQPGGYYDGRRPSVRCQGLATGGQSRLTILGLISDPRPVHPHDSKSRHGCMKRGPRVLAPFVPVGFCILTRSAVMTRNLTRPQ